jgi:hypothetical protein
MIKEAPFLQMLSCMIICKRVHITMKFVRYLKSKNYIVKGTIPLIHVFLMSALCWM